MKFRIMVDDNFHYMDEDERYCAGECETLDEAVRACEKIVDTYLESAYTAGMTAEKLFSSYRSFGEDPWISGADIPVPFSAWKYARRRCIEICSQESGHEGKSEGSSTSESAGKSTGKRIVLSTFGSLGDLHPYVAMALELQRRGHRPVIATNNTHRDIVEAEWLPFHAVRPDIGDFGDESALMKKIMHLRSGPEFILRELLLPHLAASYEDLYAACKDADLLVSHPITLMASLVAETKRHERMRWASVAIAPSIFLSAYDPPVFAPAPWLLYFRALGPRFYKLILAAVKAGTAKWFDPWQDFRRSLGLPPTSVHPLFDGQFSPKLVLALFSSVMAQPQRDWPPNTVQTGFPFYDRRGEAQELGPELEAFLRAGDAPIVFTLGSSAVRDAGNFYHDSAEAARRIGKRAVLLVGKDEKNRPENLGPGIAAFEYAPFSGLLPRACAAVHQGGIGTTAQALRAGHPMLVVPFGFDQPDNAARVTRLGVARTVTRARYTADRAATELAALLGDAKYARKAEAVGAVVRAENGTAKACDAIEELITRTD